ncbi:MAG TPA: CAP domain-containing protein [Methanosarcinaceae archaeon]|nr:CAP domain-containing protein [Methanosarcinaceae archaeon]
MNHKIINVFAAIGFLFITLILIGVFIPSNIDFDFYVDETHESIDGDVYLGNEYLGHTQNGKISIDTSVLYPGEISIKGTYNGESFNFIFDLTREDIELSAMDFYITQDDLNYLTFKSTDINTEKIEDEIFKLINEERRKNGITELKRSQILDDVAKDYSNVMVEDDFYAHTNPEGIGLHERLSSRNIFFFAATENLNYVPVDLDSNVAEETVMGWIESPGHRVPILDTDDPILWDHIGIGVSCVDRYDPTYETTYPICYITAEFASFEAKYEDEIKKGFIQFIYLHDKDLGLNFNPEISVDFSSNNNVDLYIVPNYKQYERFLNRAYYDTIVQKFNVNYYEESLTIKPEYGLIIDASDSSVKYNLSLTYNP